MAVTMTEAEELDLKNALDAVIARAGNDIPAAQREMFSHYVHALYHDVSLTDVTGEPASQHGQRVSGFWQWGQTRAPQEPKVRIHNPATLNANWRQDATFIEIITDDMPFLVDSVSAELARLGLATNLLLHPVFGVVRDADGVLQKVQTVRAEGLSRESWMHISIERQPEETLETIRALLLKVLADVRVAVMDWRDMRQAVAATIAAMPQETPPGIALDDVKEAQRFAEWLDNDHFVFLGYRDYKMSADGTRLEVDSSAARGILRDSDLIVLRGIRNFDELPHAVQAFIQKPEIVFVNKTQARSTIHRSSPYDIVGIRRFSADGRLMGLRVFIGLFTSLAYGVAAQDVPWLRLKVEQVLARSHLDPKGHSGKALVHILNTYPRDDLFQIGVERLYGIARGILVLAERVRTALFVWHDPFNRFVSCLIFSPRDRFDTTLRKAFISTLEAGFGGTAETFVTTLSDSPLVRVQVVINLSPESRRPDIALLEKQLIEAARGWDDKLADELVALHGAERGLALRSRYAEAFPAIYRAVVPPNRAADDITSIESVLGARPIALTLHSVPEHSHNVQVRLFHRDVPLALSDIVPHLENLGLRIVSEVPFGITPKDGATVWVSELLAESRDGSPIALDAVRSVFIEAFHKLWDGALEDDRFNLLVLHLGLNWREVSLLRAYAKYLQQARFAPSTTFIRNTLAHHTGIADLLVRLFHAQFDPAQQDDAGTKIAVLLVEIERLLEGVTSLAEDEVLRRYLNLIRATLRTNYYQMGADGQPKPYISFKLDSQAITDLPLPRPLVEIWVYSPRVEGVHLRGGRVARGGLRWSDRRDDFRTEILGLMKAQMVKNAVIVPVGSKGGFYCKQLPLDRAAEQKEVVVCYQTFIRGLLDLTDNRVGDGIVTPSQVVRRDGDDPYLVVAADKGTAKFSDTANALSLEYGFWLGDAFASGGSAGYDHKVMGITARGAWESVKRHFRERGVDIQTKPFTCVGVGDMAGDVFGNGLLRSPVTLLVGAFNHKHIFLDPNPDPATSFAERKRLFDLPGSQWSDYDPAKISSGGGVFERAAKTIALTPEVQARFGLKVDKIAPNELIKVLLKANVDLLYLGGIGTYLKATDETDAEVNDRANDAVRVNAAEIRAKVVGEGANLGVTARARIEFARKGGAINSDAIDNSGGVDTSDHEVNIKIALQPEVASGALSNEARNSFLAGMTEEVAALVLKDNYLQPQAITLEQRQAPVLLDAHARMIQTWEKAGRMDRAVEFLPSDEQIAQRAQMGEGLSRPELAIVLAHAKLALCDELVRSTLPDDAAVEGDLMAYFPKAMRESYEPAIKAHRLRREIIATVLSNDIVNRMGPAFVQGLSERSGHSPADVVRACLIVRQVFDLKVFWRGVELLDNKVPAALQLDLLAKSQTFMARTVSAVLQMAPRPIHVAQMVADLAPSLQALEAAFNQSLPEGMRVVLEQNRAALMQQGVPEDVAVKAALLETLASGPDILVVAKAAGQDPARAAIVYYAVGHRFTLDHLRAQAQNLKTTNHWQRQEALALAEDLYAGQQKLAVRVLQSGGDLERWSDANAENLARCDALLREINNTPQFDLSMLAMVGRSLRNLAGPLEVQK